MTQKITLRQEEYLLFFAERSGRNASIAAAAERFNVAKPTVSRFTNLFEEYGLIRKNHYGEVELTDAGWEHITPLLQNQREISEWMVTGLGLLPNTADQEARKLVTTLEQESVDAIIQKWRETKKTAAVSETNRLLPKLEPGTYEISFDLLKRGQETKSMGDRGFRKPACLIYGRSDCEFRLYPKQIEYRPFNRCRIYLGTVERLWYRLGEVWKESRPGTDGGYHIPGAAVRKIDREKKTCTVPIRIRAAVNQGNMPESEADLVFEWNSIREEHL